MIMTPQQQYKEHGFCLIKNFIPIFFADYLKEILNTLEKIGNLTDGDPQVKDSLCVYGNPAFDTFGLMSGKLLSKTLSIELLPTYTYSRIYLNGSDLKPHLDRAECEHSATLFLGGEYVEPWPIWIQQHNNETVKCVLNVGDAVVYKGNKVVHWREKFEGTRCYQLFMHYVDNNGLHSNKIYDSRPYLGLKSNAR